MSGFGRVIKSLRVNRGMNITELAKKSDISRPYLSQIESDERTASLDILQKLSVGLNLPLATLIESAGYPLGLDKDTQLIHSFLKSIEVKLLVYSEQIEELESKKHELYRQQNGLLNDLNKKQEEL